MQQWIIGVLLTILSAAGSTTGLILQKVAHVKVQKSDGIDNAEDQEMHEQTGVDECPSELEPNKKRCPSKVFGIPCNKYFIAGFIMLVVVPLPLDLIALANAGQSLILAVGTGCTVIFGQILAPKVLNESLTRHDVMATFFITIGVFISTITGTHETPVYTSATLLHLYTFPAIIITIVFISISTTVCIFIAHNQKLEAKIMPLWLVIPYQAYIPSSLGGLQIMVFKMVGELAKNTFDGYEEAKLVENPGMNSTRTVVETITVNEFLRPLMWVCILVVIVLATTQLSYLNRGLAKYNAIKFLPIYNTLLLMIGVTSGAIYFREYSAFDPVWFPVGIIFEMLGILALTRRPQEPLEANHLPEKKEQKELTYQTSPSNTNQKVHPK